MALSEVEALKIRMEEKERISKLLDAHWQNAFEAKAREMEARIAAEKELATFLKQEDAKAKSDYGDF